MFILNYIIVSQYYCIFDQINAALESRRDFGYANQICIIIHYMTKTYVDTPSK